MTTELEHIEAIKRLKARYFRYVDTKQWDRWATVFTEDVVLRHPANRPEPLVGRDEVVARVSRSLANVVSVHHGYTPEIQITGEREARGIWSMSDILIIPPGDPRGEGRIEGHGHYIERYVLEADGEWRIAESEIRRLHMATTRHVRDVDVALFGD